MIRKTCLSAAALAATLFITFVGIESSGAYAQAGVVGQETTDKAAELTDEVVPVFVAKEVAQPLPDASSAQTPEAGASEDAGDIAGLSEDATSLSELVAKTPTDSALSDEMRCLAGAVYFEARGEPLDGQLAVAQVIINRTESRQFPASYCGVVHQRSQFSFVRNGQMPRIKTASAAWKRAIAIARIAHGGHWDSKADDALYFHAKYVRPSWSRTKVARATIDTHIFYR